MRCPTSVHLWGYDHDTRCVRPTAHLGDHTDGLVWWTSAGLLTSHPTALDQPPAPGRSVTP